MSLQHPTWSWSWHSRNYLVKREMKLWWWRIVTWEVWRNWPLHQDRWVGQMFYMYVMWSSKMSLKLVKFDYNFSDWLYISYAELPLTTDSIEIDQLVPKIQAFEGLQKQEETKILSALFGCILKSVFASCGSFCLITSHIEPWFKYQHLILWPMSVKKMKIN